MAHYLKFSQYLRERYGCRVHKVSVHAGFSCPNRDGTTSRDGCIYCDNRAFSPNTDKATPLADQIRQGIEHGRKRYGAEKFIVYFQSYTNTYAHPETLKRTYNSVREFQDVVGISIGTRPDCVDKEILDLIAGYTEDYEVWIEYGLQSIHDKTLALINRNHTYDDFLYAVELTRCYPINICAHVIIGLPGETPEDIMATAGECARLELEGIKIHPLHVIKGTKLEELYREGKIKILELEEYAGLCTQFLKLLPPETVIHRLTADCPNDLLVAPLWLPEKEEILKRIDALTKSSEGGQKLRGSDYPDTVERIESK